MAFGEWEQRRKGSRFLGVGYPVLDAESFKEQKHHLRLLLVMSEACGAAPSVSLVLWIVSPLCCLWLLYQK